MPKKEADFLNIDPFKFFRPLIAGLLLNAYYSALNLKKASGAEITEETVKETILEVYEIYGRIDQHLIKLLTEPVSPPKSPPSAP